MLVLPQIYKHVLPIRSFVLPYLDFYATPHGYNSRFQAIHVTSLSQHALALISIRGATWGAAGASRLGSSLMY